MSGIGVRKTRVSGVVLASIIRHMGVVTNDMRQEDRVQYLTEKSALHTALAALPPDAVLIEIRAVDRMMAGRGANATSHTEFDITWGHHTFPSDQESVIQAPEPPKIPESWDYARSRV